MTSMSGSTQQHKALDLRKFLSRGRKILLGVSQAAVVPPLGTRCKFSIDTVEVVACESIDGPNILDVYVTDTGMPSILIRFYCPLAECTYVRLSGGFLLFCLDKELRAVSVCRNPSANKAYQHFMEANQRMQRIGMDGNTVETFSEIVQAQNHFSQPGFFILTALASHDVRKDEALVMLSLERYTSSLVHHAETSSVSTASRSGLLPCQSTTSGASEPESSDHNQPESKNSKSLENGKVALTESSASAAVSDLVAVNFLPGNGPLSLRALQYSSISDTAMDGPDEVVDNEEQRDQMNYLFDASMLY